MNTVTRRQWRYLGSAARLVEGTDIGRSEAVAALVEAGTRLEQAARRAGAVLLGRAAPRRADATERGHTDNPSVVLINGWSASSLMWPQGLIERLQHAFHVVRVDNRGTGPFRDVPWPCTVADMAADVRRLLTITGVERPVVVGLSMGGMVAQELAVRWPQTVGALVLVGTMPPSPERVFGNSAVRLAAPPGDEPFDAYARRWARLACAPGFAERHPEVVDELVSTMTARPAPVRTLVGQARAIAGWHGARRLRSLAVPTVVVHGAHDTLSPVRNGMRLAQLIPNARYVELADIGHLVPYEAPQRLAETIESTQAAMAGRSVP